MPHDPKNKNDSKSVESINKNAENLAEFFNGKVLDIDI